SNDNLHALMCYSGKDHLTEKEISQEFTAAFKDNMAFTLHKDSSESELTGHVVEAFEHEKRRRITVDFPDDNHFAQKKRAALIAAAIDAMFTAAATTSQ
ncbi:hypothetical protein PFISCL1PPCAC_22993, partial [Pristionchus fissidentatus]